MHFIIQRVKGGELEATQLTSRLKVLNYTVLRIGRGTDADIRFDDPSVALLHTTIEWDGQRYILADRGSIIGTWVDGEPVKKIVVQGGESVEIGTYTLKLLRDRPEMPLTVVFHEDREHHQAASMTGTTVVPQEELESSTSHETAAPPAFPTEAPTRLDLQVPDWVKQGKQPPDFAPPSEAPAPPSDAPKAPAQPPAAPSPAPAAAGPATAQPPAAAAAPAAAPRARRERAAAIADLDYAGVYGLKRRGLSKASLSLVAGVAVFFGVSYLLWADRRDAFRPGPLSSAHRLISGAQSCNECHSPFKGVESQRCERCHQGPEHHPRQATTPECLACHIEHRFIPNLADVDDPQCVECHEQVEVDDGQPLVYADGVTDFAATHPDFSVTWSRGAETVRVPLREAVERKIDATPIKLNHELHLNPEKMARLAPERPQDAKQLTCESCHALGADDKLMTPISYEEHCSSCHQLAWVANQPLVPHGSTDRAYEFILRNLADRSGIGTSSIRTRDTLRRLSIIRRGERARSAAERVEGQALDLTERLFRSTCSKCHEVVDADDALRAEIVVPEIPTDWLPHGEFTHGRHANMACDACHSAAETSTETADVLLQGIETCLPCHGGVTESGRADPGILAGEVESATTECVSCHLYHARSKSGEWAATPSAPAPPTAATGTGADP
ncbi:MAG TPA: FHA domain-containing protein [Thermoanaerobaculia bacterium]|nr:FHA domain-containing protein [Thermoanaerobaculia bacterium]